MIVTKTKNFPKILQRSKRVTKQPLARNFRFFKMRLDFFLPPFSLKLYATYGKPIWYFCFKKTSTVKKPTTFKRF